jgi:hypothetical protein
MVASPPAAFVMVTPAVVELSWKTPGSASAIASLAVK